MSTISNFFDNLSGNLVINTILSLVKYNAKEGFNIYVTIKSRGRYILNLKMLENKEEVVDEVGVDLVIPIKSSYLKVNIKKDSSYEVSA